MVTPIGPEISIDDLAAASNREAASSQSIAACKSAVGATRWQ
jgi:hypothetical protein